MRIQTEPPTSPADYPFSHSIRVRFAETDAMGIVHHAAYLPYLEAARVEYLRAIDRPYTVLRESGVDLAVIEAHVRYIRPLQFDDVVEVHVVMSASTRATLQMSYLLTANGHRVATAVTAHACVDPAGRPTRMPTWLAALSVPSDEQVSSRSVPQVGDNQQPAS